MACVQTTHVEILESYRIVRIEGYHRIRANLVRGILNCVEASKQPVIEFEMISGTEVRDHVMSEPAPEHEGIGSVPARQLVVPVPTNDPVGPVAPEQEIVPTAPIKRLAPVPSRD